AAGKRFRNRATVFPGGGRQRELKLFPIRVIGIRIGVCWRLPWRRLRHHLQRQATEDGHQSYQRRLTIHQNLSFRDDKLLNNTGLSVSSFSPICEGSPDKTSTIS